MKTARLIAILALAAAPLAGAMGDDVIGGGDRLSAGTSAALDGDMIERSIRFRASTFQVTAEVAPRCGVSAAGAGPGAAALGVDCSSAVNCLATVALVPGADARRPAPAASRRTACRFNEVMAMAADAGAPVTVQVDF